ncbi:MAG: hypothetical protein U9Q66_01255 [Patescibacteria group bacterium]|nr:hypothetical protein [Patescibacteria group bacterium]
MILFIIFILFFFISSVLSTIIHFSDSSIATGRVESNFDRTILIIAISGTDKNIPTIHQIYPQNHNAIIITSGLRFNLFHINLGSTIFHINI